MLYLGDVGILLLLVVYCMVTALCLSSFRTIPQSIVRSSDVPSRSLHTKISCRIGEFWMHAACRMLSMIEHPQNLRVTRIKMHKSDVIV